MQLLIDTNEDSPAVLLRAARLLMLLAEVDSVALPEIIASNKPAPVPTPPPIGKPVEVPPPPPPIPANVPPPPPPVVHPEFHPDVPPPPPPPPPSPTEVAGPLVETPAASAVPAPPSAAPAPTTIQNNALPATIVGVAFERDSAGIPWDARVHSETRKKNADGTWRFRRNLDESVKNAVMAELRAVSITLSGTAVPPPPPPPPPPPQTTLNFTPAEIAALTVPPPPPPPPPVSPPAAPPVPVPPPPNVGVPNVAGSFVLPPVSNFRELMNMVNVAIATGFLTHPQLLEACKNAGVDSIAALATQPIKVPEVTVALSPLLTASESAKLARTRAVA